MLPTTPYRIASNEGRTRDLALTKRMLCQLSYRGESVAPGRHSDRLQRLFADCKKKMPPPGIAPGLPAPQAGVLLLYYSGRGYGGSGYRSRFSTLRRLYATMYNNPPCASIGTRTRILSLEGINTTLVLWTHVTGAFPQAVPEGLRGPRTGTLFAFRLYSSVGRACA